MSEALPNPDVETVAAPEPTLRDTIKASMAEAVKAEAPPEAATQPAETKAATDDAKARDEQGRFAKGEKRETLTLPKKDEPAPTVATQPAPTSPIRAPDGWSAPAKAKFVGLDPEVQAEIVRRENDMHRKFTSQDEDRTFGKKIKEIAQPYEAIMRAEGASVEDSFRTLMNMAYVIRTAPPETKRKLLLDTARAYNVDLGTPLQQATAPSAPALTPADVSRLTQAEVQQHQSREEQRRIASDIEAFKAKPGHEHFDSLQPVISGLLMSGKFDGHPDPLQGAYEAAMRADPELGSALIVQKVREAEEERIAKAKTATDAAKRAAVSVTGSPGGVKPNGSAAPDNQSLRDNIRANLAATQGRV